MPPLAIHVFARPDALRDWVLDQWTATAAACAHPVIGLTTGTTPLKIGLFDAVVARINAGTLSLKQTTLVNPDEFVGLPAGHAGSYYTYSREHLLDRVAVADAPMKWIIPDCADADGAAQAAQLESAIRAAGGIDWQLLGIGLNGHVCFVEPAASLPARCYVTPIAESNRRLYAPDFGGDVAAVPTHAVTYGLATLMAARSCCLVAVGAGKADIVAEALLGPISTMLPASLLQVHPHTTIALDTAAAASLLANQPSCPWVIVHHE